MIVEYYTACGCSRLELAEDINEFLSEGWELYGNPYASINGDGDTVHNQAMVRRAE